MPEGVVLFKGANLEQAIRDALEIPTELLKKEDLEKLTELDYDGRDRGEIVDLTGIEHCTRLFRLSLFASQISNIDPISNLKKH